jgi:hypothetical protein
MDTFHKTIFTMPADSIRTVLDERCLLKIARNYSYTTFLYHQIGNSLDITSNELIRIRVENHHESHQTIFYKMLLLGRSKTGGDIFNKLYLGFENAGLENDFKNFLARNNMTECLPSVN